MTFSFTAKPNTVDVYLESTHFPGQKNTLTSNEKCSPIKWEARIDVAEWGIKDITPMILDQEVTLDLTLEDLDKDSEKDISIQVELTDIELARDFPKVSDTHIDSIQFNLTHIEKIDEYNYKAKGKASVDFSSAAED